MRTVVEAKIVDVAADLERRFGPPRHGPPATEDVAEAAAPPKAPPQVVCYYFEKSQFEAFGRTANARCDLLEIHSQNPYYGCRFNAVYSRP
jgi:hypothetical protein